MTEGTGYVVPVVTTATSGTGTMTVHVPYSKVMTCADGYHDWRTNPFITLTTDPPMLEERCPNCGAKRSVMRWDNTRNSGPVPNDPSTWPRSNHP